MTTLAAIVCAALTGALLARRPSPLQLRLGSPPSRAAPVRDGGVANASLGRAADPSRGQPGAWRRAVLGMLRHVLARLAGRWSATRRAGERENDTAEICLALSAELRSGVPLDQAVMAVSADWPDLLGDVAAQAAIGGDVATALRNAANVPGASALAAIAAGWDVAERTGAPLSRVLLAVADSLRMAAAAQREAQSQLATARTTARLMAVLPVGTLLVLSGGDQAAIRFLFTPPVGLACTGVAVVLVSFGLWWVGRVARTVPGSAWTA